MAGAFRTGTVSDIFCEPDATNGARPARWLLRALLEALPGAQETAEGVGIAFHPVTADGMVRRAGPSELRILLPYEYPRALAKIAFHYLLWMDPHVAGHEDAFCAIRAYIRAGTGSPSQFVELNGRPFVMDKGSLLRGIHHFLFVEVARDQTITVRMQFFVGGHYKVSPISVKLGRDPFLRSLRAGHAIRIFEQASNGFDGEILDVKVGQHDALWGVYPPPWSSGASSA